MPVNKYSQESSSEQSTDKEQAAGQEQNTSDNTGDRPETWLQGKDGHENTDHFSRSGQDQSSFGGGNS